MRKRTAPSARRSCLGVPGQFLASLQERLSSQIKTFWQGSGVHAANIGLILVALSLLVNFAHQVLQSANLETQRSSLATEVTQLETETNQLKRAVEYAESDASVERVAREQLGYANPQDTVLVPQFLEPTPPPTPPDPSPKVRIRPTPAPNWQLWWKALFGPEMNQG